MSDNLHNIAPFVSAEEGWENMQGLLNLHLPVNGSKKKRPVLFSVTACILCFVFAFISYKLDNGISPIRPRQAAMFADNQNIQSLVKTTSYSSNSQMAFGNRTTISTKNISNDQGDLPRINNMHDQQFVVHGYTPITLQTSPDEINIVEKIVKKPGKNQETPVVLTPGKKQKQQWSIYAGLALNNSLNSGKQNLIPYPVAEFKYHINHKLFVAAGASIFSPVAAQISGVNKSVLLNDTGNNILYYHEITNYKHLKYADFPISIGMQLSKKWSVQTGIQFSVLMYKKTNKTTELLDYQLNNVNRQNFLTPVFTMAANSQLYPVHVPGVDYRSVTTVRYKFKQAEIGVSWQYSLKKSQLAYPVSSERNQLLSVHALLRINGSKHQ